MKKKRYKILNKKLIITLSILALGFYISFNINNYKSQIEKKILNKVIKSLNTKVRFKKLKLKSAKLIEIEKIEIYNEFKRNKILIKAEKVKIKLNWLTFLKNQDKLNIKLIKSIKIIKAKLFIDENFNKQKLINILFKRKNKSLIRFNLNISFKDSIIISDFQIKDSPKFFIKNIDGDIKITKKENSYKFKGILIGDKKYFYLTKSLIKIKGKRKNKENNLKGKAKIKSLNYLGYNFKNEVFIYNYNISNKILTINRKIEKYKPKLKANKQNKLKFSLKYKINKSKIKIKVSSNKENPESQKMLKYYIEKVVKLKKLSKHKIKSFNYKVIGNLILIYKNLKLNKVKLKIKNLSNIIYPKDNLSFNINSRKIKTSKTNFKTNIYKLAYSSPNGVIKGNCILTNENGIEEGNFFLEKINISKIINKLNKKNNLKNKNQKEHLTSLSNKSISSNLTIKRRKSTINFKLNNNQINNLKILNLKGYIKNQTIKIVSLNKKGKENHKILINLNPNSYKIFNVKAKFNKLIPKELENLFNKKNNIINFNKHQIQGKLKAKINLNNIKKSKLEASLKLISSKNKKNNSKTKIKSKSKVKKEKIQASLKIKYNNSKIIIKKAKIQNPQIELHGILSLKEKQIESDLNLKYLNQNLNLESKIKKLNNLKYIINLKGSTKSQNLKLNLKAKLKIKNKSYTISWKKSSLNYNKNIYTSNGEIKKEKERLKHKLKIKKNNKQNYNINGITIWKKEKKYLLIKPTIIIKTKSQKRTIKSNLKIKSNSLTGISILNSKTNKFLKEKNSTIKINFNFSKENKKQSEKINQITLNKAKKNIYKIIINLKKNKKQYKTKSNIEIAQNQIKILSKIQGLKIPLNLKLKSKKIQNRYYLTLNLKSKDKMLQSQGYLELKNGLVYKNLILNYKNHFLKIKGSTNKIENQYLTNYKLNYKNKKLNQNIFFKLEGLIKKNKNNYNLNLALNKSIHLKGKLKNYQSLKLDLFFNNHPLIKSSKIKLSNYPKSIKVEISRTNINIKGRLLLENIKLGYQNSKSSTIDFSYNTNINNLLNSKGEIVLKSIKIKEKENQLFNLSGKIIQNPNQYILYLKEKNKSYINYKYNIKEKKLNTIISIENLTLNKISKDLKGNLNTLIEIEGEQQNPKIKIKKLSIKEGKYKNYPFNMEAKLIKHKNNIKINKLKLKFKDNHYQIENINYKESPDYSSLNKYKNKNTLIIKKLKIKKKEKEIEIKNLILDNIKKINLKKIISKINQKPTSLYKQLKELIIRNSKLKVENLKYKSKNIKSEINNFKLLLRKNWNLNLIIKLKGKILNKPYKAKLNIFGGKQKSKTEFNLQSTHLNFNKKKFKDINLIIEGIKENLKIRKNKLGIEGNIKISKTNIYHKIKIKNKLVNQISISGSLNLIKNQINTNLKILLKTIKIKKIIPVIISSQEGIVEGNLKLTGNLKDPKIEGQIKINKITIKLKEKEKLKDIQIKIELKKEKTYISEKYKIIYYNNKIQSQLNYKNTNLKIQGYFNLKDLKIKDYEIKIKNSKTLKKLKINNNFFRYTGDIKGEIKISGKKEELDLSGSLKIKNADFLYIGAKRSLKRNIKIKLKKLKINIGKNVLINIGKNNISLGEVILKENSQIKISTQSDNTFKIQGELKSQSGYFDYLGTIFFISKAEAIWQNSDNPTIKVNAYTKLKDENNQLITIFFNINSNIKEILSKEKENNPLKTFFGSFSSIPNKSPFEISSLLGLGQNENQNKILSSKNLVQQTFSKTTNIFVNVVFVKPLEKKIRKLFGGVIDSISIRQNIIQNTILKNKSPENETLNYNPNLIKDTSISIKKNISKNILISTGLVIKQDSYNQNAIPIFKVSIETDLLRLLGIKNNRLALNQVIGYNYYQFNKSNKHEISTQLNLSINF